MHKYAPFSRQKPHLTNAQEAENDKGKSNKIKNGNQTDQGIVFKANSYKLIHKQNMQRFQRKMRSKTRPFSNQSNSLRSKQPTSRISKF